MTKKFALITAAATLAASAMVGSSAIASTYSYTGGTYTQNFNSLPNPGATSVNTGNPVTINGTLYNLQTPIFDFANSIDSTPPTTPPAAAYVSSNGGLGLSSTMSGWYGGAATQTKFGATFGDQTTGGDLSFGPASSSNRALGLIATSTTGATYFGLDLVNNTGLLMTSINVAFTGEQWKQGTLQKTLSVGYTVDNTNALNVISAATSTSYHELAAITNSTTGTVGAVDGTATGNQTPELFTNLLLNTPLVNGGSLWITGQISNAGGSGQGYGIDNFSFSNATPSVSVPEPASLGLLGLGSLAMLRRRRQAEGIADRFTFSFHPSEAARGSAASDGM